MTENATNETPNEDNEQTQGTPPEKGDKSASDPMAGMIPKARLDSEIAKRKAAEEKAAEWDAYRKQQEDEAAKNAGQIDKFKSERDAAQEQVAHWTKYAEARLESLTADLDEGGQKVLAALGEDTPLAKRLSVAEQLAAASQTAPGFGTTGGKSTDENNAGGLIPQRARASRAAYEQWLAEITASGDPKKMEFLLNADKRRQLEIEARQIFG